MLTREFPNSHLYLCLSPTMHRIALRNSARKVALAAAPRVRSPTFLPFLPRSNSFFFSSQQNSALTSRTYATAKPGLYFLSPHYSVLTCGLSLSCLAFNLPPYSRIRGFLNTGVPHLGFFRRWKRRRDWSCFECVGIHALNLSII